MVDSVKNYGITGVGSVLELGKAGPKIDASRTSKISLTDSAGQLITAEIGNGSVESHAVTLAQLQSAARYAVQSTSYTVDYDSGSVSLATLTAGSTMLGVTVEKTAGNWVGADAETDITIGDASNNSRYFAGFDPTVQVTENEEYTFATDTEVLAYITPGGASSGSAYITLFYSGTTTEAPAGGGGGGGSGTAGVDNVVGYDEMQPPVVAGQQLEDGTATINGSTGFTINNDNATGIAISGLTASNQAFFATYGTGTKTVTWGAGSTVASSTINVITNNPNATPQLVFFVQGQSGAATYNYPFTFS